MEKEQTKALPFFGLDPLTILPFGSVFRDRVASLRSTAPPVDPLTAPSVGRVASLPRDATTSRDTQRFQDDADDDGLGAPRKPGVEKGVPRSGCTWIYPPWLGTSKESPSRCLKQFHRTRIRRFGTHSRPSLPPPPRTAPTAQRLGVGRTSWLFTNHSPLAVNRRVPPCVTLGRGPSAWCLAELEENQVSGGLDTQNFQ